MEPDFSQQVFEKYSNIKFHENPSSGSRVVLCDGQTDMTKLTVSFRILGTRLKNYTILQSGQVYILALIICYDNDILYKNQWRSNCL